VLFQSKDRNSHLGNKLLEIRCYFTQFLIVNTHSLYMKVVYQKGAIGCSNSSIFDCLTPKKAHTFILI